MVTKITSEASEDHIDTLSRITDLQVKNFSKAMSRFNAITFRYDNSRRQAMENALEGVVSNYWNLYDTFSRVQNSRHVKVFFKKTTKLRVLLVEFCDQIAGR